MKRVAQLTSRESSSKRSRAVGSRSIPISVPLLPMPLGDQARMAAAADRAVDDDRARLGVEQLDQLAGEHGHVGDGHLKQCGHLTFPVRCP